MTPYPSQTVPALQSQPLLQQPLLAPNVADPTGNQTARTLGAGLAAAARVGFQLQDKLDESQARDMTIELTKTGQSLLMDPESGFLRTQGVGALQARPEILERFQARAQELEEQLQTKRAKQLFRQQAGLRQIELQQRVDAHTGREADAYEMQSRAAALDQYTQDAIDSYGLPGIVAPDPQNPGAVVGGRPNETSAVRQVLALREFDAMAKARGIPNNSPLYKQLRTEVTNKIAVGIAERLMAQDPAQAWRYLRTLPHDDLKPESRRKLLEQVQEHADTSIGISTARQLLETFQDQNLAQEALVSMMLKDPGAMTPAGFDRARQEIGMQGRAAEGVRKAAENRVFELAKQYVAENPGTTFDGLPSELRKALQDTFQRDDFDAWVGREGKVETNPIKAAELGMKPASWWRGQTLASFARDYQRHLAPDAFERWAKLIGVGPQADNERSVKDLDMIAAQDAGILDRDEPLDQQPAAASVFMRFQVRVDQLSEALAEDERDPVARRAKARQVALSEKSGDTYRWNLTDEERANTPIQPPESDVAFNVSRGFGDASRAEMDEALAALGQSRPRSAEIVRNKLAQYRNELAKDPTWQTDDQRELAAQEAVKADLLVLATETEVVTTILERRKKAQQTRQYERLATADRFYTWETLERLGVIKSRDDAIAQILSGKSLAGRDDIRVQAGFAEFKATDDAAETLGLSEASVNRMMRAAQQAQEATRYSLSLFGQVAMSPGGYVSVIPQRSLSASPATGAAQGARPMTPSDRAAAIRKFEMLHAAATERAKAADAKAARQQLPAIEKQIEALRADWPVTKEQIDALVAQRDQLRKQEAQPQGSELERLLHLHEALRQLPAEDPRFSAVMQDPRWQAVRAQAALASADFAPTRADAEAAWEAYLQNGGESWMRWERENGPQLKRAMAQSASEALGGSVHDAMRLANRDAHLAFRAKILSVLGELPGTATAGQ